MKIIVAPNAFKDALDARTAARALACGLSASLPDADLIIAPAADGGDGTLETVAAATAAARVACFVRDPLGRSRRAYYLRFAGSGQALVEIAQASGLACLRAEERDAKLTSSYGSGQLMAHALAAGNRRLIVTLGGSATNDGGAGLLQALGARFFDTSGGLITAPLSGAGLARVAACDPGPARHRVGGVEIDVACDVTNPLCGEHGASRVFGPQKGATPSQCVDLDRQLSRFYALIERTVGIAIREQPGAGAAGGIGAALAGIFGATLRPGAQMLLSLSGFEALLADAALVVTGEGAIDTQTLYGKAPAIMARLSRQRGIPVVAVGGQVQREALPRLRREFDGIESLEVDGRALGAALAATGSDLVKAGERIGMWWKARQ